MPKKSYRYLCLFCWLLLALLVCAGCRAETLSGPPGHTTAEELIYHGVSVGVTTEEELASLLGPADSEEAAEGFRYYIYGGVTYCVDEATETVCRIAVSDGAEDAVYPGIKVGVSVADVLKLFPEAQLSQVDAAGETIDMILIPALNSDVFLCLHYDGETETVTRAVINIHSDAP